MEGVTLSDVRFVDADPALRERLGKEWGACAARHMHLEDGFSLVAFHGEKPVGLVSVRWQTLPQPLPPSCEGYIDIIEVVEAYRRKGLARKMVQLSLERAKDGGAVQLRAWSTDDKTEAIPMWKALGFALCPATHSMWGPQVTGYFVAKRLD
jgi:GNAT superfamily N-acetyltransferase